MGPRSVTADRITTPAHFSLQYLRFNGAAVCHRGSVLGSDYKEISTSVLQWGRGLSPRIGFDPGSVAHTHLRFNGAAVCHRGSVKNGILWVAVDHLLQWGRGLSPRIGAELLQRELEQDPELQWGRGLSPRIGCCAVCTRHLGPSGFNGAAVCHRGSGQGLVEIHRNGLRFNGAAVCHRGSGLECGEAVIDLSFASMGPRSVTADRAPATGPQRGSSIRVLQWGRGLSPRIGPWLCSRPWPRNTLQWGRGLSPRIGRQDSLSLIATNTASMGPRSVTADRGSTSGGLPPLQAGFNGAAVCHRGSGFRK